MKDIIRTIDNKSNRMLFLLLLFFIFASNLLVMYIFSLPLRSEWYRLLLDSFLAILLVIPSLFFLMLRPMNLQIEELKIADKKLQRYVAELEIKNAELQDSLLDVKTLSGMLPICASCKKIRDDKGFWSQVEEYISAHSETVFTSGICPECEKSMYAKLELLKMKAADSCFQSGMRRHTDRKNPDCRCADFSPANSLPRSDSLPHPLPVIYDSRVRYDSCSRLFFCSWQMIYIFST